MKICLQDLMDIPSVIAVDETVITERNGTWVLILKYNMQTGFEQEDLNAIDKIIVNNPMMNGRKFEHHPFRKKQPIESSNTTALSGQESRYKDFTATLFSSTDSWSSKLFPPRNITTKQRRGGGESRSNKTPTSNKTGLSIEDDTTVATLTDTVSNLKRTVEKLTAKMETLGSKQGTEKIRVT
jgi:hypothetical protein